MQSTQPLHLENVDELMKYRPSSAFRKKIRSQSRTVNAALSRACNGLEIPVKVRGLSKMILYYLAEADRRLVRGAT